MWKNLFKYVIKTIDLSSVLNLTGLITGITVASLLFLWIKYEYSFDRFHKNGDNIYRVVENKTEGVVSKSVRTPFPLAQTLYDNYSDVENATRILYAKLPIQKDAQSYGIKNITFADSTLFDMFTFDFVEGNKSALTGLYSVVLSEKNAKFYFGDEPAVGKVLTFLDQIELTVTAVIKDYPQNTDLDMGIIIPCDFLKELGVPFDSWTNTDFNLLTYLKLKKNASYFQFNSKISGLLKNHLPDNDSRIYLQSLKDIHLHSNFSGDVVHETNIKTIYILIVLLISILVLSIISYTNFSIIHGIRYLKFIRISRIFGGKKSQIIKLFSIDIAFASLIAVVVSIILTRLVFPVFQNFIGKSFNVNLFDTNYYFSMFILFLIISVIIILFPVSVYIFKPYKALQNVKLFSIKNSNLNKILIVVQFSIPVILLIIALTINRQIEYLLNKDVGFDKESLIYFPGNETVFSQKTAFRNELMKNPHIKNVGMASGKIILPPDVTSDVNWQGKDPDKNGISFNIFRVDKDFIETCNMKVLKGKTFKNEPFSNTKNSFVVNKKAASIIGDNDILSREISAWGHSGKIIGVIDNIHLSSLQNKPEPVILILTEHQHPYFYINIEPDKMHASVKYIDEVWKKFALDIPIQISYVKEEINNFYESEIKLINISKIFFFISLLFANLSLLSISSSVCIYYKKTIAIKRVLGASKISVMRFLYMKIMRLILLSNVISWFLAYYFINNWLENFAYRVEISIWIFIFSSSVSIIIATFTVIYHTTKTVLINPSTVLHAE